MAVLSKARGEEPVRVCTLVRTGAGQFTTPFAVSGGNPCSVATLSRQEPMRRNLS